MPHVARRIKTVAMSTGMYSHGTEKSAKFSPSAIVATARETANFRTPGFRRSSGVCCLSLIVIGGWTIGRFLFGRSFVHPAFGIRALICFLWFDRGGVGAGRQHSNRLRQHGIGPVAVASAEAPPISQPSTQEKTKKKSQGKANRQANDRLARRGLRGRARHRRAGHCWRHRSLVKRRSKTDDRSLRVHAPVHPVASLNPLAVQRQQEIVRFTAGDISIERGGVEGQSAFTFKIIQKPGDFGEKHVFLRVEPEKHEKITAWASEAVATSGVYSIEPATCGALINHTETNGGLILEAALPAGPTSVDNLRNSIPSRVKGHT